MSQHRAVTLSMSDMLLYRNRKILHLPQPVFHLHLTCVGFLCTIFNSIMCLNIFFSWCLSFCVCVLALMFLASEMTSNVACDWALSAKRTLFCCQMTQKSRWESPCHFQNPALWSSVLSLLIGLTTLAHCLIHSLDTLHVSTGLSYFGMIKSLWCKRLKHL